MKKWKNVVIICSLILNVLLIIGFLAFRYYMRFTMFELSAVCSNTIAANCKHALSVLDFNDAGQIPEHKEFLKMQIESNTKAAQAWEKALKK
jgi:hypothetical protein